MKILHSILIESLISLWTTVIFEMIIRMLHFFVNRSLDILKDQTYRWVCLFFLFHLKIKSTENKAMHH